MQLNQTDIYLRKRLKVVLPEVGGKTDATAVATVAKNLQTLGFGLSTPLLHRLAALPVGQVQEWYESVVTVLKTMVGAHREFKPMYPNFPQQVMDATDAELYFNAMVHYFGFVLSDALGDANLVILPNYEKAARPILEEFHDLRWIDLGSTADFEAIFTSLTAANGSLSKSDQEILEWFIANCDVRALFPQKIPQKETLAFLVGALPDPAPLIPAVKTATDVLRVAVALSKGDISLAEPTKFRSYTKYERRFLLRCLENVGAGRVEDMLRWKSRWIRLGERLHPGDFRNRYPKAYEAFAVLRNNQPFQTFNGRAEAVIGCGNGQETATLLKQRPGDFARRLDHVLRSNNHQDVVLKEFLAVTDKVSTPVLLQAWNHFGTRNYIDSRSFFPKGNVAKVQHKEGELPELPEYVAREVAAGIRNVLIDRFRQLPPLGNVFLDDRLKDQIVPFSQRSASRSLRSIARGSRFDLPDGDVLRFFCWWKNIDEGDNERHRVDIDLSASLFGASWESLGEVAYYDLRKGLCHHSGDITSAPKGACEFIDINLDSVLQMGARFVVMSVLSYTGQPFLVLPECFGGWMMRKQANSGEVFEPKTVQDKIDITATTRACIPVAVDAATRKVVWTDLGLKSTRWINNAAQNAVGFRHIGQAIMNLRKPSMHDLFLMHAEARGEIVAKRELADTVFDLHEGDVTAFDTDVVLSDYLL